MYQLRKGSSAGKQSLFYAGKASLGLYRRSKRVEDLDRAIRYLTDFQRINLSVPFSARVGKELASALALKGKIARRPKKRKASPFKAHRGFQKEKAAPAAPGERLWSAPAASASISQRKSFDAKMPAQPNRSSAPLPAVVYRHGGNPFYRPGHKNLLSITLPVRRAAVPPRTMIDLPSARLSASLPTGKALVVIDPGHGGKDPGAVSRDGLLKEKDVTLKIALALRELLRIRNPNISVVLTREDDRFLPLEKRTAIANSLNADLFVSIHCNSSTDHTSRGIETYYLSNACSEFSREVAARENGVSRSFTGYLKAALRNLVSTTKKTESDRPAELVHKCLINRLGGRLASDEDRGVKRAPFNVLLGANMPAILVECAFVSNPRDRRKLESPDYIRYLADGMAVGADMYLKELDRRKEEQAAQTAATRPTPS